MKPGCPCGLIPSSFRTFVLSFSVVRKPCLGVAGTSRLAKFTEFEDVPLVELMYLVLTRMPGESYRRRLGSSMYLCYVFRALINSLVC